MSRYLYRTPSSNVPAEVVPREEVSEWVSDAELSAIYDLEPRQKATMPNGDTWERVI